MDEINENINTLNNNENVTVETANTVEQVVSEPEADEQAATEETRHAEADITSQDYGVYSLNRDSLQDAVYRASDETVRDVYTTPNINYQNTYSAQNSAAAPDQRYSAYANGGVYQGYYQPVTEPVRKPQKQRHLPKFVSVLLSAVLFGLVAAAVFIGTNKLYDTLNPKEQSSPEEISTHHTPGSNDYDGRITDNNADTVAASTVLTNIDASVTDVSKVVENVMPTIVSIDCTFYAQSFFGYYETSGAGSGIILKKTDTELLIATNNHVVDSALTINVTFADGKTAPAVIKGTDSLADLAVVAVDLKDLEADTLGKIKVASLGDSDAVKVGQMAIAIGNAMGYGQSTTVGYISAKDREVSVDGKTMTLLQTDAAINPGNSGGALLNLNGEVIGINSVKYASDEVEGMGFAIPISRATAILDELGSREILKDEDKGYLGISIDNISADFAAAYNFPMGVYVTDVVKDGAADKAGICKGDIITAINGTAVATTSDLKASVTSHKYGTTISVTYQRRIDGEFQETTVDVELQKYPETDTN